MEDFKLSLCITTYNRPVLTIQAFEKVYADDRISEIVIVDDCSNVDELVFLTNLVTTIDTKSKIHLFSNTTNLGMSRNKARALEHATNDWCILFDSDNILDVDYLDAFYAFVTPRPDQQGQTLADPIHYDTIFCPDFAAPDFNYRKYSHDRIGLYDAKKASALIYEPDFNCMMNTCNYIVHRETYLRNYVYNHEHIASDTIWHNYNHLKHGGIFAVVPNMQYYHRVHKFSGFMQDINYNMQQAEKVRKLISELCS